MKDEMQGVMSVIEFPLGQDEVAIGKAIHNLLFEGWHFSSLTKTHISFGRKWEADLSREPMICNKEKEEVEDKTCVEKHNHDFIYIKENERYICTKCGLKLDAATNAKKS